MTLTNREVRSIYNIVSKRKFGKLYGNLNRKNSMAVRKYTSKKLKAK